MPPKKKLGDLKSFKRAVEEAGLDIRAREKADSHLEIYHGDKLVCYFTTNKRPNWRVYLNYARTIKQNTGIDIREVN